MRPALLSRLFSRFEARTLATLFLILAALWAFFAIAGEIAEGEFTSFDKTILLALRSAADTADPIGPPWFEIAMRDFTALGGWSVLTLLSLAAFTALLLLGQRRPALILVLSVAGGQLLSHLAKGYFDRPRPELVAHIVEVSSSPSGHSMMAAVTYLTLAAMLARATPLRRMKAFFFTVAILVSLLVGISRVYLGVHWPSDVLAGWAAGAAWALGCALLV
jgi:undecaprenyl-diphosphatase